MEFGAVFMPLCIMNPTCIDLSVSQIEFQDLKVGQYAKRN